LKARSVTEQSVVPVHFALVKIVDIFGWLLSVSGVIVIWIVQYMIESRMHACLLAVIVFAGYR